MDGSVIGAKRIASAGAIGHASVTFVSYVAWGELDGQK